MRKQRRDRKQQKNDSELHYGGMAESMTDEDLAINMMCPNENGLAEIDCDK